MASKPVSMFIHVLLVIVLLIAQVGCSSIRLVSDYDEEIDRSASALQRKIETFLVRIERDPAAPGASYLATSGVYDEIRGDLSAIRSRANAQAKNLITIGLVDKLEESIDLLEKMHERGLKKPEIPIIRRTLFRQIEGIVKLELAKKRGEAGQ